MEKDKKQMLYNMYNATSTDNGAGNDELETYENWLERQLLSRIEKIKQLDSHNVSGNCQIHAIMHYDKLIKTKLQRTFEPLQDHGTHADFCDKINNLREEAKSNYL